MKVILFPLFVLFLFSSQAQFVFKPHFGINFSTGPATYHNPTISNIGFAHDYHYGQATQLGIKAMQPYKKWNFSAGLGYQFMFFAYRGVAMIPQLNLNLPNPFYFDIYYSNSTQHLAQLQIACARNLGHGIELGIQLIPSYLLASKDNYTMERDWAPALPDMMNKNIGWHKTQLMGGLSLSKYLISKKENIYEFSLNPQISLSNNGGFNALNEAFSEITDKKTRFVSCQLAYTLFF